MALTLISTFLAAVSVASCYPAAFEDLGLGGSKYCNDFLDLFLLSRLLAAEMFVFCFLKRKQNLHQVPGPRRLGWSAIPPLHHRGAEGYSWRNERGSRTDGS